MLISSGQHCEFPALELEEINRTGRVWLVVFGETMPPAYLDGTHPFTQKGGGAG